MQAAAPQERCQGGHEWMPPCVLSHECYLVDNVAGGEVSGSGGGEGGVGKGAGGHAESTRGGEPGHQACLQPLRDGAHQQWQERRGWGGI